MYWKYAVGFLIASLIQAGIIMVSEFSGLSTLDAKFTFGQLIIHILAGQAAGFLLMVMLQIVNEVAKNTFWIIGTVYGIIVWAVLIPINSAQGAINQPWTQGLSTIIASLIAFVAYGLISTFTVKNIGREQIKN
jgi:hypothetical protein